MDRSSRKKALLAHEPELSEVARGALRGARPAPLDHPELARFAKDARALFGFDELPDPPSLWAVELRSGELALERTFPMGKLSFRRYTGELVLLRRPVVGLRSILSKLFLPRTGDALRDETVDAETEIGVWPLASPFERVLAIREGKSILLSVVPLFQPRPVERAHERADDILIAEAAARRRPPGADSVPCPLAMPAGGRFPKRAPPRKKRVKR